jgi:iron complex outermembrane receptor protein
VLNSNIKVTVPARTGSNRIIHRAVVGALTMTAALAAAQVQAQQAQAGQSQTNSQQGQAQPAKTQAAIPQTLLADATQAQTAAATQEDSDTGDNTALSEVVVTGTSIKRADSAALPITAVSPDQMALRDANTPADLLTSLPQVVNVPVNDSTQGGAAARGDVAAVNLRGLGSGDTLVLLNGRRVASYGIPSTENGAPELSVNVNVLPTEGLERVDILRDGASSLYGSDAVAGVINFVTDNKYVGTEVTVQGRQTQIGSGSEAGLSAKHGEDLMDGRMHWTSTMSLFYHQETYADEAGLGVNSDKQNLVPGAWATNSAFNDSTASSGFTSFIGTMPGTTKSATYYVVPTGNGLTTITSTPTAAQKSATLFNTNSVGYAEPETKRINWFNSLDFKLNDSTTLYTEATLYRAESVMERPPVAYGVNSDTPAVVPATNPYNPFGDSFYGAAGAPVTLNAIRFIDDGPEYIEDESDFARWVGGARGEIGGSWTYDTGLMYTIDHVTDTSENAIRESAFEQYSLVQTNPTTAYNPFFQTFTGTGAGVVGTPYTNTAAQLEPFVQHFHQDGKDSISSWDGHVNGDLFAMPGGGGDVQLASGLELRYESLALDRPLYAGLNCEPNPSCIETTPYNIITPNGYTVVSNNNDFIQASAAGNVEGDRVVAAAWAETVIPVFSQKNALPGLQDLEFSAAVRYEHYSDFGGTTNPKYTMDWRPEQHVMFRASFEDGFRAPNLAALNTPTRSSVGTATDPYYNGIPTSSLGINDGSAQRFTTTGVASSLKPEKAQSGSFGLVVDVPYVEGLSFSTDFWKIHERDVIASPLSGTVLTAETANLNAATSALEAEGYALAAITPNLLATQLGSACVNNPLTNTLTYRSYLDPTSGAAVYRTCAADPRTAAAANAAGKAAAGTLYNVFLPYANLAEATTDGVDFNITYKTPMFRIGRFQFVTDATWIDNFDRRTSATGPIQQYLGLLGATRWRGDMNLLWYYGSWSAGISAYYIGDYADQNATLANNLLGQVPARTVYTIDGINYWRIASLITENVFASYTLSSQHKYLDNLKVRVGVDNLTNRAPPLDSDNAGYDPAVYQSVSEGRVWSLQVSKAF